MEKKKNIEAAGIAATPDTTKKPEDFFVPKITHNILELAMTRRGQNSQSTELALQTELALAYIQDETQKEITEIIPKRLKEARLSVFGRKLIHFGEIVLTAQNSGNDGEPHFGASFSLSEFQTTIKNNERKDNFSTKVGKEINRIEKLMFVGRWDDKGKNAISTGGSKAEMEAAAVPTSILKTTGGSFVKGDNVFLLFDFLYIAAIYKNGGGRMQPLPKNLLSVDGDAYLMGYYLALFAKGVQNNRRQKDGLFHFSFREIYDAIGNRPDWDTVNKSRHTDRKKKEFLALIETLVEAEVLSVYKILYPHNHIRHGVMLTTEQVLEQSVPVFESLILAYDIEGIDTVKAIYLKAPQKEEPKQIAQNGVGGNYLPHPDIPKKVGEGQSQNN